jgi:type VI secretion system protein ImpG
VFSKYFQEELAYLREVGREFSRGHPQLAPMLADTSGDPSVERLLEGVAFLTGRVREKLDDELPEIIHAIATLLFPQMLRPLPSACIVELLPHMSVLREPVVVPRGTELGSVPVDGITCRFQSTSEAVLVPWEIERARVESIPGGRQQLRLEMRLASGLVPSMLTARAVRFHLASERRAALDVLKHLHQSLEDVVVVQHDAPGTPPRELSLGRDPLRLVGFDDADALLLADRRLFPGYRLLQEYYALPEKFAFFDLLDLGRGMRGGEGVDRYDICLRCKGTFPSATNLDREWIRLHCVPVVNLFNASAEPVRVNAKRERFRLRVANLPPPHGLVYAVTGVHHIPHGSSERVAIPYFYDFAYAGQRERPSPLVFYDLHLAQSMLGEGADSFISFGTPRDAGVLPDAEVVSVDLIATNGRTASSLPVGDVRVSVPTSPVMARFRSLTATTPYVPAPLGRELAWRMVAQASMGLRSLAEPEVLRAVMETHNFQAVVDRQAARVNELRIGALKDVKVSPIERLYRGAPVRGIGIDVHASEEGFLGEGDLFLFSAVLDRLFADYVSLNSFSRLSVTGQNTQVKFQWPARSGSSTLI